jgi:hypothetical protein
MSMPVPDLDGVEHGFESVNAHRVYWLLLSLFDLPAKRVQLGLGRIPDSPCATPTRRWFACR